MGNQRRKVKDWRPKGNRRPKIRMESNRETGSGTSIRGQRETEGNGGRETDGDPSGSSRVNRPQAFRLATRPWKRGRERPSGRTSRWLRSTATSQAEFGPRPDVSEGMRIPERVEASAKTPSGFSRVWRDPVQSDRLGSRLHGLSDTATQRRRECGGRVSTSQVRAPA